MPTSYFKWLLKHLFRTSLKLWICFSRDSTIAFHCLRAKLYERNIFSICKSNSQKGNLCFRSQNTIYELWNVLPISNYRIRIAPQCLSFTLIVSRESLLTIRYDSHYFITPIKGDIKGGSRTAATSKIEHLVIIVNGWKPLTIITKRSILDIAAVLDPPLDIIY